MLTARVAVSTGQSLQPLLTIPNIGAIRGTCTSQAALVSLQMANPPSSSAYGGSAFLTLLNASPDVLEDEVSDWLMRHHGTAAVWVSVGATMVSTGCLYTVAAVPA